MSSSLEKAIQKAKRAHQQRKADLGIGEPDSIANQSSGLFHMLKLAAFPRDTMEHNKIIPAIEDKAAIGAYKMLRTRVLQRLRSNAWRNVVVSGAGPGEGKTLTACNLAVSMAGDVNQTVFLVDLDLQRSSVAQYFGMDVTLGIGDYLEGKAEIEDIVYAPADMERIAIIPNRAPMEHSSDLISSPRMKALMTWLKERNKASVVIFDMPPILACDDVLAFLPSVDALLLVVAENVTQRSELERAVEVLGDVNLLGVVLNRTREHHKETAYY